VVDCVRPVLYEICISTDMEVVGLDILLKFTIKLLFGELFAALMKLITSLLTLSGGSGLLGLLTPLLSGDLGNLLNLFGLLDKILGKSR